MTDSIPAVPIVKGRRPAALIVIGENPDPRDREAAGEIQRYVEKLGGARLEIVGPEEALTTQDNALLLVGGPDANSLAGKALHGNTTRTAWPTRDS